jgi:hypothetical protein
MFRSGNDDRLYAHKSILTHREGEGKEEKLVRNLLNPDR